VHEGQGDVLEDLSLRGLLPVTIVVSFQDGVEVFAEADDEEVHEEQFLLVVHVN
jgi:hypothetical protein